MLFQCVPCTLMSFAVFPHQPYKNISLKLHPNIIQQQDTVMYRHNYRILILMPQFTVVLPYFSSRSFCFQITIKFTLWGLKTKPKTYSMINQSYDYKKALFVYLSVAKSLFEYNTHRLGYPYNTHRLAACFYKSIVLPAHIKYKKNLHF